jgi:AcrR family transcriptional regulator
MESDMEISQDAEEKELDPRVRRTRKMLQDALDSLLKEKDFESISIGDIAEKSTVNRATFYDHYPDKYALLQCLVGSQFQELVAKRNICFNACEGALKNIAAGVCYYLAETTRPGADGLWRAGAPMETAIISVVRRMILEGFRKHPPKPGVPVELVSSTIAWAIYGAAKEWAQSPKRMSVDKVSGAIEKIVAPILTALGQAAAG